MEKQCNALYISFVVILFSFFLFVCSVLIRSLRLHNAREDLSHALSMIDYDGSRLSNIMWSPIGSHVRMIAYDALQ